MRIIIETDNATPMTLQVAPPDGGQGTTTTPTATSEEDAAVNAGAAPSDEEGGNDGADQSSVEQETFEDASMDETSAGEAPDDKKSL